MNILPHKLAVTSDQLTSLAGLLAIAQIMESLKLSERINQHFPLPKSNRGFDPSIFIETIILMQHEGGFHLDDVRHPDDDHASPAKENLEFILQCEQSLPDACFVQKLRIDLAGYQKKIIEYCDNKEI